MGVYLNPGNDKFYKAINSEIYVDKTELIQYTNRVFNTMQQNVCVSRPRRFGKSMTANMLAAYYSRGCQSEKYSVYRELPTGKGFADMVFIPRKKFPDKPALVVELKWDKNAKGAISQIKQKQYCKSLEEYTGNILLAGINYSKKDKEHQCMIEKIVK